MKENYWLEIRNVSSIKNDYEVVKNLSLNLKFKENVILIGPNGSGKSSLIELINRNIYPILKESTIFKILNKELINIWELRKKISTVNTDIRKRIKPDLKVLDLIIGGLYGKYCKIEYLSKLDILLAKNHMQNMKLSHLSQKYFGHLSEGEKQIILISRALIANPEILILDEPIANLDLKSKFYVIDKVNELSKINTTILCTTHDITSITEIYSRIIMMKDRTIIYDGTQKEVMTTKNINKLFDINIKITGHKGNWNIQRKLNNDYK